MTALRVVDGDRLRCAIDAAHPVTVTRSGDRLLGWCSTCFDYSAPTPDVLASVAWYDSHENLALLLDWLGEDANAVHVAEKPWKWQDEWRTAAAARDHEHETDHRVLHGGSNDETGYCDDCGWNCDAGTVFFVCLFCEDRLDDPADVERKAHLGCAADVALDEQVAQEVTA